MILTAFQPTPEYVIVAARAELCEIQTQASAAMTLMQTELSLQLGLVPTMLEYTLVDRANFIASRNAFIINIAQGLRFFYRRGAGVRYSTVPDMDRDAITSFHHGSVYGAIAWMNQLVPLHASAITVNGRVHAFAGASGAGKSTLVAALEASGLPVFADDVLTLVPGGQIPMALPGHKQLKLWLDALALTGHSPKARVWPGVEKFYVEHVAAARTPLPLASLTLIETNSADDFAIVMLQGTGRFAALRDARYRPEYMLPDQRGSIFTQLAALAGAVPVFRFSRPRELGRFQEGIELITKHLIGITT